MLNRYFKILLVDDDEDERFIFEDFLGDSDLKFELDWVGNFDQAVEKMSADSYDIYFVDYRLGAQSGIDLLKGLERSVESKPVIMLTGEGNKEVDQLSLEAGAYDFLKKSVLDGSVIERSVRYAVSRYENQQQIVEGRFKYQTLFEQSLDMIVICDLNFEVYECNPAFQNWIGTEISKSETIRLSDFIVEESICQNFEAEIREKRTFKNYELILQSVGGKMDCVASVNLMRDLERLDVGYQIIFHDITQMRQAAEKVRQAEQLDFAGKMARLVAHEVRNPLTNINLAVEQVATSSDPDDEDSKLYFDIIRRNSNRINDLISQLLDSSGPGELKRGKTTLGKLIGNSVTLIKDRANLYNVNLDLQLFSEDLEMEIDTDKMQLAIANILTNAIEALSDRENPMIKIVAGPSDIGVGILIKDNGRGMSKKEKSKVFEPFFTSRKGGKGLGMTLTKNVITAHGGQIRVESQEDVGTTFFISLS